MEHIKEVGAETKRGKVERMEIQIDTDLFKAFIKNYWEYFRELEAEFLQTRKYVEFCKENNATFSIEYLKLYQAVCSEIDVVGKWQMLLSNRKINRITSINGGMKYKMFFF